MTYGSLFSGVGGADLGLHRAGLRPLWFCEWDRNASDVLRYHWPEIRNYGDVSQFPAESVDVPDVLWMSPPCQDLSVAKINREGLAGHRSGLFYDAVHVAATLARRGTRFVIMEQVPGLFSANGGGDFRRVLLAFLEIGARDIAWRVLDSQYFGVPQRRRRLFLAVDFRGGRAGDVLSLGDGLYGDHPESGGEGKDDPSGTSEGAREPMWWNGARVTPPLTTKLMEQNLRPGTMSSPGSLGAVLAPAICIKGAAIGRAPEHGPQHGDTKHDVSFCLQTSEVHAVAYGMDSEMNANPDLINALKASGTGSIRCGAVAFAQNQREEIRAVAVAGALSASPGTHQTTYIAHPPYVVRRLTPKECERLQSWPDDHTRYAMAENGTVREQSKSARYKQCGNGVTANVAAWLATNLISAMEGGK